MRAIDTFTPKVVALVTAVILTVIACARQKRTFGQTDVKDMILWKPLPTVSYVDGYAIVGRHERGGVTYNGHYTADGQ